MTREERQEFVNTKYYILYSKKTNLPYLNVSNMLYLFETKMDAEIFKKNASEPIYIKEDGEDIVDFGKYYNMGFDKIYIFKAGGKKRKINITEADIKVKFYNKELNKGLLRMKQTSQNQYIRHIKKEKFLTPVLIEPRQPKEYPNMFYCSIKKQDINYYLMFSTIEEFNEWKGQKEEKWEPLEITLEEIIEIFNKEYIYINPLSIKLILSIEQIKTALNHSRSKNDTSQG